MTNRENFGSRLGAILAAAGSAVGLGNIWRFPIETGRNGGAAFILVYIACILIIGLPIMISEFLIGRHTQANTARAYQMLAPGSAWKWVGRLGVFTAFFIMCYYCVVSGWTMHYGFLALTNGLAGHDASTFPAQFSDFVQNPFLPIFWMLIFVLLSHVVIVRGVTRGIERWSKILMPLLFILVLLLVVVSVIQPGGSAGLAFLLRPYFSKVTGSTVLSAMGQAFYSLSLAMGCLCTYASYFNRKTDLARTAVQVSAIDTMVAIMAGFIIFPAAAAANYSLSPSDIGPSLIFITLPNVFQQAFGAYPLLFYIVSSAFYVLIILAALTSMISLHEVVTSYLTEEFGFKRSRAALLETIVCIFFGCFASLSFGPLNGVRLFDKTIFDLIDWTASNICLPIGGFFISIFAGWRLDRTLFRDEVSNFGATRARYFRPMVFLLRYVVPLGILGVLLNQVGLF